MMLAHKIALDPTNKQRTYFARARRCFLKHLGLGRMEEECSGAVRPNRAKKGLHEAGTRQRG